MNHIEVKLQGETRLIEFDQPVSWSDLPTSRFYLTKNFWIGLLSGIIISAISIFTSFSTYDANKQRVIGIRGAITLQEHGLYWSTKENAWVKDTSKPDFITYPSP